MKLTMKLVSAAALLAVAGAASAQAGQTVKIAWIDPLTHPLMAPVGNNISNSFKFAAEKFNANNPAGVRFEVTAFDNKLSPQESVNQLNAAIDQGFRYVTQGQGTSVAAALIDAIAKHNERNPGKEIVYLNYAAVDPDLTGKNCNYWHFSFDANTAMKMGALTDYIKDQKKTKKVYLQNQNYGHGHQVAAYAKDLLAKKRPDIAIAGEDLTPLAQVRDFSPYIAKINASGADAVITGNWGGDLSLLAKAAIEGGFTGNLYTYYAGVSGTPTVLASAPKSAGKVIQASNTHSYLGGDFQKTQLEFKQKHGMDFYTGAVWHIYTALTTAMAKAKSTDPVKVAAAMEGLKFNSYNGEVEIRAQDHQLQQPVYITVWDKTSKKWNINSENTDMTFVPVKTYSKEQASAPSVCQMQRP